MTLKIYAMASAIDDFPQRQWNPSASVEHDGEPQYADCSESVILWARITVA